MRIFSLGKQTNKQMNKKNTRKKWLSEILLCGRRIINKLTMLLIKKELRGRGQIHRKDFLTIWGTLKGMGTHRQCQAFDHWKCYVNNEYLRNNSYRDLSLIPRIGDSSLSLNLTFYQLPTLSISRSKTCPKSLNVSHLYHYHSSANPTSLQHLDHCNSFLTVHITPPPSRPATISPAYNLLST